MLWTVGPQLYLAMGLFWLSWQPDVLSMKQLPVWKALELQLDGVICWRYLSWV